MSIFYEPIHFAPQELISPAIYNLCGPDALYMYDPDILRGADELRNEFGPMIGNTYHDQKLIDKFGLHRFRGLRSKLQETGSPLSTHKIGIKKIEKIIRPGMVPYSGIDLFPVNYTAVWIREQIKKDEKHWIKYFKRMETHKSNGTPLSWIHGDSKPHNYGGIRFFKQ